MSYEEILPEETLIKQLIDIDYEIEIQNTHSISNDFQNIESVTREQGTKEEETKEEETKENLIAISTPIVIPQDKIRHLVVSGGSVWGFYAYGVIREAVKRDFINMASIESMYLTSVGSIVGVLLSLDLDFESIDDYLIKRPWNAVLLSATYSPIEIYEKRGIFNKKFFEEFFTPLFKSVDIDLDITMSGLYKFTGIDIHIYVTEINKFELLDISYKTHPDWKVIDAIYASCTIPFIFSPIIDGQNCYLDGGLIMNYPISKCIDAVGAEFKDTIFGISLGNKIPHYENINIKKNIITEDDSFFDFANIVLGKLMQNFLSKTANTDIDIDTEIKYGIKMCCKPMDIPYMYRISGSADERRDLIDRGSSEMSEYFAKWFL